MDLKPETDANEELRYPQKKNCDDSVLLNRIKRAQEGDEAVMTELLDEYRAMAKVWSSRFYIPGGDNDDTIQEGMVGLFKAIKAYQPGKTSFVSFAHMCVIRHIGSVLRVATSKKNTVLTSAQSIDAPTSYTDLKSNPRLELIKDENQDVENRVIRDEENQRIKQLISNVLTPYEQAVLTLRSSGEDYHSIATTLGKTEKSIDNALQRIKRKIRVGMSEDVADT